MRIIADRKDYYDCIQAQGQDQSVVYLRKEKKVQVDRKAWPFPPFCLPCGPIYFGVNQYIIGFCGKIYPLVRLSYHLDYREPKTVAFCYSSDEVDAFMSTHMTSRQHKFYLKKTKRRASTWWLSSLNYQRVVEFFTECQNKQDAFIDIFMKHRCPIFVASQERWCRESVILLNAMLNEYEFYRVFDPYTTFQEISIFLGGMAMPEKEMPVIDDVLNAESHGFDKWSFRTPPLGANR